jgi:hypothetical protein
MVIMFRAISDTLHVQVFVARNGNPSKEMGCQHFCTNNLCLTLKFLCSTAKNATLQSTALQQTGTILDHGKKFIMYLVSSE